MVCNYQIIKNQSTGEYILDFVMSERNDGHVTIIEWNAYHYKSYTDNAGHKGVVLFGVSHRAYDDKTTDFLKSLGTYRQEVIKKISEYPIPDIQLK
jgi:hypothetical protein